MLVWKEVARPEKIVYQDEVSGKPCVLDLTPEGIKHLHDSGKEMLAAGLSIPLPLEHQPDAKPLTKAERAAQTLLNNTGWVTDYKILPGDRLFAHCKVEDAEVYKKLPLTIKYTSPHINSFTDGDGHEWKNVITHLALTSRPRIIRQEPFPSIAAALSAAAPVGGLTQLKGATLSRAGALKVEPNGSLTAARPMAFSLWVGNAKLALPELEEKKKKPEGKEPPEKEGKEPEGEKREEGKPPEKEGEEGLRQEMEEGELDLVEVACNLMSIFDVELPEDTSEDNLLQNLLRALMDKLKMDKGPEHKSPESEPEATNRDRQPVLEENPPMYMSLEEIEKVEDPKLKHSLKLGYASQQNILKAALALRQRRLDTLNKRLPKEARDILTAQLAGAKLSLSDDGGVLDPLAQTLEILEKSLPDMPKLLTTPGASFSEEAHPVDAGQMSEERRQELVEEFSASAGVGKKSA